MLEVISGGTEIVEVMFSRALCVGRKTRAAFSFFLPDALFVFGQQPPPTIGWGYTHHDLQVYTGYRVQGTRYGVLCTRVNRLPRTESRMKN